MLKDLPFFGTTRVANKGVDVALIVRPSHTAEAFSKAVSAIKKKKGKAEPESDETGIIW